jgi:DNA-binding HxlR family transcriptional regulator
VNDNGSTLVRMTTDVAHGPEKTYRCGVDATLSVLGGKWKLLLLYHLLNGATRNGELRRLIPTISQKVLTQQLRELERDGLVRRTTVRNRPLHVEYAVEADRRAQLEPVVEAVSSWGLGWVADTGGQIEPVDCPEGCATG